MDWVLDDPSMSITEYMSHRENFLGSNHIKGSEAFETCTKDTIYYCFPRRNEKKMCPLSVHYAGRPLPVYIQSIKKINYTGKNSTTGHHSCPYCYSIVSYYCIKCEQYFCKENKKNYCQCREFGSVVSPISDIKMSLLKEILSQCVGSEWQNKIPETWKMANIEREPSAKVGGKEKKRKREETFQCEETIPSRRVQLQPLKRHRNQRSMIEKQQILCDFRVPSNIQTHTDGIRFLNYSIYIPAETNEQISEFMVNRNESVVEQTEFKKPSIIETETKNNEEVLQENLEEYLNFKD